MKIAFIGQKGIPAVSGGVEKHVENIAVRLAALGHEVTVYVRDTYTDPRLTEYMGVRLVHTPALHTKHLEAITHSLTATLHAIFFEHYAVIHYHSIGPSVLSILPRLLKPSARVIATFHSRDYFHQKWNAFARLCLRIAECFTCMVPEKTIVISETLQKYATETYKKDFSVIPNGAEVRIETDTRSLSQWGLRPGRYALSVSRLVRHKGIHYLIKAFRELEEKSKIPNNFKLAIVGSPANTSEYAEYLETISVGCPNIVFLGEQSGSDLDALFSHAALFVQPSEDEGLSLALLEAMASERLAIVSDIPANLEAIQNGAGVSFRNKDVEDLKEKLAFYINRPEEAKMIAHVAKERAEKCYSWDAIARRTLEVYEETIHAYSAKGNYVHARTK